MSNHHKRIEEADAWLNINGLAVLADILEEHTAMKAALEAKSEPVAYITQAALDALKRGASSSVRVWRKPDERLNGDVALYTKESL